MRRASFIAIFSLAFLSPLFAASQTISVTATTTFTNSSETYNFKRQGVFGCSQTGSYSMSVGSLSAVGGVYVPVNDAAVTLNTGYLVYKECVLRGVVDRQREAAAAGIVKQVINVATTGREGNPLYTERIPEDQKNVYTRGVVSALQSEALKDVNPAYAAAVKRAVAQGYRRILVDPSSQFECSYQGNIQTARFSLKLLGDLMNPACNPYWSYDQVNRYANNVATYDVQNIMTQLGWGEGYFPVEVCDEYGANCKTVTPSSLVRGNVQQALQSGYEQLERANDIDQMIGALFSGMTSQVLGDNRGIQGLMQRTGNQPSYIDQVVREAAQGLRDAAGNAALQILAAAKQIEAGIRQAMEAIKAALTTTILELRAKETACWQLIIDKVCDGGVAADKTCSAKLEACTADSDTGAQSCPTPYKLKVATSTVFSQAVINARVAPLASSTEANIEKANSAIVLVDRLIAGITNSASVDAQRVALQQLDNLVAQRALHSQYDLQDALKARDDVTASQETLRTDTVKAWADSTDINIGWCNVNNKAVLDFWKQKWKQ